MFFMCVNSDLMPLHFSNAFVAAFQYINEELQKLGAGDADESDEEEDEESNHEMRGRGIQPRKNLSFVTALGDELVITPRPVR